MAQKQIIVINSPNSLVSDNDVRHMIYACSSLMKHVVASWEIPERNIMFHTDMTSIGVAPAPDAQRFFITDEPHGVTCALDLFGVTNPTGFVFTRSILSNNGVPVCDNTNHNRPTVAAALFKAIAESAINPKRNIWWNDPMCGEFIAAKICDPVEAIPVIITLTYAPTAPVVEQKELGESSETRKDTHVAPEAHRDIVHPARTEEPTNIASEKTQPTNIPEHSNNVPATHQEPTKFDVVLCNFVFPAWSDPGSPDGSRFDFGNILKHSFQVGIGGCCSKYDSQPEVIPRLVFDRRVPAWKRELTKANYISFNTFRA